MFEATPPRPEEASPLTTESWQGETLRRLTWADLVARLSATRGVHADAEHPEAPCDASFDPSCARRIAAHHGGKPPVNPDDLSNGKGPDGTAIAPIHGAGLRALRK